MLLISRIVAWDGQSLEAEADVMPTHPLAVEGRGIPCWAAIEFAAQAAGALDGIRLRKSGCTVPPGYLLGTRRLDGVAGYFASGTTLHIRVEETLRDATGLGVYTCRLQDGERTWSFQLSVYRPKSEGTAASG
jgi:predicted hotdog family 3-hydroxylacyl-ACP dehydratase